MSPLIQEFSSCKKMDRFWKLTVGHCKLHPVLAPIAGTRPRGVVLLEKTDVSPMYGIHSGECVLFLP